MPISELRPAPIATTDSATVVLVEDHLALHKSATPAPPPRVLSRREREILGLLANGMNGSTISEMLDISSETVRTHVRNAMRKLGARTRVHAVTLALQRGEISLHERC